MSARTITDRELHVTGSPASAGSGIVRYYSDVEGEDREFYRYGYWNSRQQFVVAGPLYDSATDQRVKSEYDQED